MNQQAAHSNHILPISLYLKIGGLLLVLTAITVIVSFYHFGPYNLLIAMIIAATKATLVALFFMHMKYDNKLYMTLFVSAILFLAVFIILTMFDTLRRGDIDPEVAHPFKPEAVIYDKPTADTTESKAADSIEIRPDTAQTAHNPAK